MARPERNEVDYFPFYCKEGKVMFILEQKYGNDGYATWIKILRALAVTNYHYLDLSNDIDVYYLATKCRVENDVLIEIINLLALSGEIDKDIWEQKKVVWNQKFVDSIEDAYSRRNNKPIDRDTLIHMLGGLCTTITPQNNNKDNSNPQSKEDYIKEEEIKEKNRIEKENKLILFDSWWNLYKKKVGKDNAVKKWLKLSIEEINKCLEVATAYEKSNPDKQFQKDPTTYLNGKHWEDEIIIKNNNNGKSNTSGQPQQVESFAESSARKTAEFMQSIVGEGKS